MRKIRYAVIEIGSNTIKLLVAEWQHHKWHTLIDTLAVTRLGENVAATAVLSDTAIQRNREAVQNFWKQAQQYNPQQIDIMGTMALRQAQNGNDFAQMIQQDTGIPLQIISGEQEAACSYTAVQSSLKMESEHLIFDIGGGSTEFSWQFSTGKEHCSLPLGVISLTQTFLKSDPPTTRQCEQLLETITHSFAQNLPSSISPQLIGVGGTVTTLAAMQLQLAHYDADQVHGFSLTQNQVIHFFELLAQQTTQQRQQMTGLHPLRADVIVAGVAIVLALMHWYQQEILWISDRGIRFGWLEQQRIKTEKKCNL